MLNTLKWILLVVSIAVLGLLVGFKTLYGSGARYPDISTKPTVAEENFEQYISLEFPPGMVAASPSGRLFFTYHMLHQPERAGVPTLYEWVNDKAVPFPNADAAIQRKLDGSMGITIDNLDRLWVTIPGGVRNEPTRFTAFDINSGDIVFEHTFNEGEALGSQDFRVSSDGSTIYTADTGLFQFQPAYIGVFDVASKTFRKVLVGDESVNPQDWKLIRQNGEPHDLLWGMLDFRVGVDGIALSADDQWLYYGAMTHDSAYRIQTRYLLDKSMSDLELSQKVELLSKKPISDGIELDNQGNLIVTDIENGGLSLITASGEHSTLVKSDDISWSDSVTVAPDGAIYFTDSALAHMLDEFFQPVPIEELRAAGPYYIYQVRP